MEWLALGLGALYLGLLGFFVMGRVDRFCQKGGFRPGWDGEEEKISRPAPAMPPSKTAPGCRRDAS